MKTPTLLALAFALSSLPGCLNGGPIETCDAGRCGAGGGAAFGGGAASGGGAAGTGGGAASGGGAAGTGGGEAGGGGAAGGGAGDDGGLVDAGVDAGCGGAVQLAFVSPAQTLRIDTCSAPVKVQVQDRCGAPVLGAASVPVSFTSGSTTLALFSDSACTFTPFDWAVGAGASELELYVQAPSPGAPTLQASAAGLDAGTQRFTIACPANQRECQGACIAAAGCCTDTDCAAAGPAWVCNAAKACVPPPCGATPSNCFVFDDRTASGASRTVTFGNSGYSPKCMRVTASQDVTFSGSFFLHPLEQTCGPSNRMMSTTTGTTKTLRFTDFGTYGYRCATHPAFEQGAIRVP